MASPGNLPPEPSAPPPPPISYQERPPTEQDLRRYEKIDEQRRRSRRATILAVFFVFFILVLLAALFLYLNLKKNKTTVNPLVGDRSIQDEDGNFWVLGGLYWSTSVPSSLIIPDEQAEIVYTDGRRKDPNSRWFFERQVDPNTSEVYYRIRTSFVQEVDVAGAFIRVNTLDWDTEWPPELQYELDVNGDPTQTIISPYPGALSLDNYGTYTATRSFRYTVTDPVRQDPYTFSEFIMLPQGPRTEQGFPFHIKVREANLYLASVAPPPWPIGQTYVNDDSETVEGFVDFLTERNRLYVKSDPQTWYIS